MNTQQKKDYLLKLKIYQHIKYWLESIASDKKINNLYQKYIESQKRRVKDHEK